MPTNKSTYDFERGQLARELVAIMTKAARPSTDIRRLAGDDRVRAVLLVAGSLLRADGEFRQLCTRLANAVGSFKETPFFPKTTFEALEAVDLGDHLSMVDAVDCKAVSNEASIVEAFLALENLALTDALLMQEPPGQVSAASIWDYVSEIAASLQMSIVDAIGRVPVVFTFSATECTAVLSGLTGGMPVARPMGPATAATAADPQSLPPGLAKAHMEFQDNILTLCGVDASRDVDAMQYVLLDADRAAFLPPEIIRKGPNRFDLKFDLTMDLEQAERAAEPGAPANEVVRSLRYMPANLRKVAALLRARLSREPLAIERRDVLVQMIHLFGLAAAHSYSAVYPSIRRGRVSIDDWQNAIGSAGKDLALLHRIDRSDADVAAAVSAAGSECIGRLARMMGGEKSPAAGRRVTIGSSISASPAILSSLGRMLESGDNDVRAAAARAIGGIGGDCVAPG